MKKLFQLTSYIRYRLKATTEHGVHSPFVFDLLQHVIYNFSTYYCYASVEEIREQALQNANVVTCIDLGAGSSFAKNKTMKVNEIANHVTKPAKYAQLLFRLVNYFQPQTIVELGTSLGITTCYLASANSNSKVITIEGCEAIAAIALQHFKQKGLTHIELLTGNFDDVLPLTLKKINNVDFVFFDGNHRKKATLNYFYQCLEKATDTSVFVFDDIYWSQEMKDAWMEIKNNEKVTVSIDLYFMGIVFFRKEQAKQHFVIKF